MFPKFGDGEVVMVSVRGAQHVFGSTGAEHSHKAQASRCLRAMLGLAES